MTHAHDPACTGSPDCHLTSHACALAVVESLSATLRLHQEEAVDRAYASLERSLRYGALIEKLTDRIKELEQGRDDRRLLARFEAMPTQGSVQ